MRATTATRIFVGSLLILLGNICAVLALANTQRTSLSIEARVAYQQAIERIYWQHRLWPAENPKPKPALEEVMPLRVIQEKVEDSVRLSNALDQIWGQPITGAQLQAEMERQARDSKQPKVLRELWAALGNDPYVIAEVLARPALVERLASNWYQGNQNFEAWWQSVKGGFAKELKPPAYAYRLPVIPDNSQTNSPWTPTFALPEGDLEATAVWTGSEMIVWGGTDDGNGKFNSGSRYDPATDSWRPTAGVGAPEVRKQHSAVWTGTEMIVWGWLRTARRA
jgi:hypothetical protein